MAWSPAAALLKHTNVFSELEPSASASASSLQAWYNRAQCTRHAELETSPGRFDVATAQLGTASESQRVTTTRHERSGARAETWTVSSSLI